MLTWVTIQHHFTMDTMHCCFSFVFIKQILIISHVFGLWAHFRLIIFCLHLLKWSTLQNSVAQHANMLCDSNNRSLLAAELYAKKQTARNARNNEAKSTNQLAVWGVLRLLRCKTAAFSRANNKILKVNYILFELASVFLPNGVCVCVRDLHRPVREIPSSFKNIFNLLQKSQKRMNLAQNRGQHNRLQLR